MKIGYFAAACGFLLMTGMAAAQPAPPPGGPHHPPPPDKGAHIRLRQGDAGIDVKCPDETPLKECADTAMRFVDRVLGPAGQKPAEPATPRRAE